MDDNRTSGRVTSSTGDVDLDGALVGLVARIGTAPDPGHYRERPGLDDRILAAGADVAAVRRLLGVGAW